jgi:hypothetical protein
MEETAMEVQFSSELIWTLGNLLGCILLAAVGCWLGKQISRAQQSGVCDAELPYIIGLIPCVLLFAFCFISFCRGGCTIHDHLQW